VLVLCEAPCEVPCEVWPTGKGTTNLYRVDRVFDFSREEPASIRGGGLKAGAFFWELTSVGGNDPFYR